MIVEYIGDGVYAQWDGCMIAVYTDNGVQKSEKIYLEPAVLKRLINFSAEQ